MLRVASENNIDAHTDTVTEFIRKCIGDVVPIVTIKTYPNQKPWIDGSIHTKLKAWQGDWEYGRIKTVLLFPQ
jgi:alpha-amylase/alpha-mannosidase (GH57 family)